MTDIIQLEQELNAAEAKVNALRGKMLEQKNTERTQAIQTIKQLVKTFDLVASDLGLSGKKSSARKERNFADKRSVVAAKYHDPSSGKKWTGRGKTPSWLAALLAQGRSKEDFLIK